MFRIPTTLLRTCTLLALCLAVLCLLAQPVLAAAHAVHDVAHLQADGDGATGDDGGGPEPDPDAGGLGRLVHVFDCCLHASALPGPVLVWAPQRPPLPRPEPVTHGHPASPPSHLLRPPIAA